MSPGFLSRSSFFLLTALLGTAGAFAQTVSFDRHTYPLATDEASVYHVDLNHDGQEDLVFGGGQPGTFDVMLSTGDGTYGAPKTYTLPTMSWTLTTGDFNRDGAPDLIFGDSANGDLYEYLNNGDGTLRLKTTFATSSAVLNIAAGDLNHDGKIDLVFETYLGNELVLNVWFGDGDGGFTKGPTTPVSNSGDLYVSDFDGDGKADVAIEDVFYTTNVVVLYGDGKGHFPSSTSFSDQDDTWFRPFDLNGDGKMDLVGSPFIPGTHGNTYFNVVRVKYGKSSRSFEGRDITIGSCNPNGYSPAIGDFNGDGINDIAVLEAADCKGSPPYSLDVLLGKSDGTYQTEQAIYSSSDNLWALDVLRVNRDSKSDLQLEDMATSSNTLIQFSNTTAGNFPPCDPPDSSSGIIMCAPTSTVASSSPVQFSIGAANQTAGRKVEVWIDGKKVGQNGKGAFSYYNFLNNKFNLTSGSHLVTVYSAGWDNLLENLTFPLTVGANSCSAPNSPGVNVCSPLNSSRVSSPVLAWAAGTVTGKVARMEVWVDGVKKHSTFGSNTLKTHIMLASGPHAFTYYIVNQAGQKWKATVNAEVK
jgi:hypothetical protein